MEKVGVTSKVCLIRPAYALLMHTVKVLQLFFLANDQETPVG